ncbi:uncharacterized protein LOC104899224 isoform X2 [Beta vulgaris subsp. vulgaris]|uniref:uncharacterized protein LOC104899224 isoform X2 n=1 Tax=Beta vulgaris subsp. vulgaris TaxID=3555 RepID=UPI0020374071|nr:uncharacterized protein LOC104899224 isoform X2 [Beta vulgaris subsp. vulgaris]
MLHLHSVVLDSFRVILCTCRITVATGELHNHRSVVSWFVSPTHNRKMPQCQEVPFCRFGRLGRPLREMFLLPKIPNALQPRRRSSADLFQRPRNLQNPRMGRPLFLLWGDGTQMPSSVVPAIHPDAGVLLDTPATVEAESGLPDAKESSVFSGHGSRVVSQIPPAYRPASFSFDKGKRAAEGVPEASSVLSDDESSAAFARMTPADLEKLKQKLFKCFSEPYIKGLREDWARLLRKENKKLVRQATTVGDKAIHDIERMEILHR